ncbi:MAG: protein-tyrosine-phosphatase [Flavobacteriales bacterium]|nr:protein-tyrosine-phosphatase [Flavobacteriales bacterium]
MMNLALLLSQSPLIPPQRVEKLNALAALAKRELETKGVLRMNFICTHNSRRSHISQLWAWAAAQHFGVLPFESFSGGVEVTSFNPRAVEAMRRAGFIIGEATGHNPHYPVKLDTHVPPRACYSKTFDDPANPSSDFIAVMVCTDAEQNCPFVAGASHRFSLSFEDPKASDGSPDEVEVYDASVAEIGREMLFLFEQIRVSADQLFSGTGH